MKLRLKPLDVRRAILSVFMRCGGGPLSLGDVVARVREGEGLDLDSLVGVDGHQRVCDVLRHQVRMGRAEAVARGVYRLDLDEFSTSTVWRCLHWRDVATKRQLSSDRYR